MRLREKYQKEISKALMKEFGYKNVMQVPKVKKVVVNVGFGRQYKDKALVDNVIKVLTRITGQKPLMNKAKKSISSFKIREGNVIGASVTMRGARMWDFLEKLVSLSFPRVRDFRGISPDCIDRAGNLTVGFKEFVSFPEISPDEIDNLFGLEISVPSTAKTKAEGQALFTLMGFPFKAK